jgi:hypothetical protein
LAISGCLVATIYFILPVTDVINRQLLFGITFQIWGIITTILVVRKLLQMRDRQRWEVMNMYIFNLLNDDTCEFIDKILKILNVTVDVKNGQPILKYDVESLSMEEEKGLQHAREQRILKRITQEGSKPIEKIMRNWQPATHKEFSKIMEHFKDRITELLKSYPHQIPPELLSPIIDVREKAQNVSKLSDKLTNEVPPNEEPLKTAREFVVYLESKDVLKLFSTMLILLEVLEKNKIEVEKLK